VAARVVGNKSVSREGVSGRAFQELRFNFMQRRLNFHVPSRKKRFKRRRFGKSVSRKAVSGKGVSRKSVSRSSFQLHAAHVEFPGAC
jgi:hypothetical protein